MFMHILVIDDEKEITDLIEIYLVEEGYEVTKRHNALTILKDIEGKDLIILDIMMPYIDGFKACEAIRQKTNIPIIMLSAKANDFDKINGLNLGADDYITKPFNPLELVARVKSHLRRYTTLNKEEQTSRIMIRDLILDKDEHKVFVRGKEAILTPTEFDILLLLAQNVGRVLSMEEIFETVWKEKYFDANNTVMVHIRKIREKIELDPRHPEYVKTVWGVGYKIDK